jgi:DNA polymerase-3 subunit delta
LRVSSSEADKLQNTPPKTWAAVLYFGPNAGLVRERADKTARAIVPDLSDAFRIADLSADVLKKDPARLSDEAAAISMFGGRRVVRVRDAIDGLAELFESFVADHKGDALVVVEAGDLTKASALRKLFEGSRAAAAVECYDDRPEDAGRLIKETLTEVGWKVEPEALAYLSEALSLDRRLLRAELEKLTLYLGLGEANSTLTRAQAQALVGDSGSVEADEIADAVAAGDMKLIDQLIAKASDAGISWTGVVGATLRLFQRMMSFSESGGGGFSSSPYGQRMAAQLRAWDRPRLIRAMKLLAQAEADTRTTVLPDAPLAQYALFAVAELAGKTERRR